MEKKVKWGIMGPGKIARSFASDFQYVKSGELVAVASRSFERVNEFASEFDIPRVFASYDDLLADEEIDAIYIATPHNFHLEQTKACLQAGKSVLCEKPITTSLAEFEELHSVHSQTNCFLMEGLWTYFLPAVRKAKEWVDQGRIGKVKSVNASFGFPAKFDPNGRLFNPDLAGGAMFDLGIYPIAIASLFLEEGPSSLNSKVHRASTGVDDDVKFELAYPNGSKAQLRCSFLAKLANTAEIIGEEGRILISDFWMSKECKLILENGQTETFKDESQGKGYEFEIEAVSLDILAGKKESSVVSLSRSRSFQELIASVLTN